jgi:all-trans-8'-apo-beta-carotenal 15,15'-oxygenase
MSSAAFPSPAPQNPTHSWHHAFRDLPRQHDFEPLAVEGQLPAELRGTLYRNGPGLFSSFGRRYGHWFDGDGAVSAVRFDGTGARGAVRIVEGPGLLEERRRGRPLFGNYGTAAPSAWQGVVNAARGRIKNTANTSVMVWQGRLYALLEAMPPVELSLDDLSTLGESNLDGVLVRAFSAHPHYVPSRKSAYNFGMRYGRQTLLDLYALPDVGPARHLGSVPLAGPTMIHDFIATERHLVFFAPPLRLQIFRQLLGRGSFSENLRWQPTEGTEVLIIPIDYPAQVQRLAVPAFYQWHFANGFDQGTDIIIHYVRYPDFNSNTWMREVLDGPASTVLGGQLHRAVLNPSQATLRDERVLNTVGVEFPRVARPTQTNRYTYVAEHSSEPAAHGMFDRVARIDLERGTSESISLGEARYPSEPVFVRRPEARGEEDGWLLTLVYDGIRDRSGVSVLEAADLARGALATAWFDHPVPFTFHGNFAR